MKTKISKMLLSQRAGNSDSLLVKVLQLMQMRQPLSKIQVAEALEISPATAGKICEELLSLGLLTIAGAGESSGGRPPILLQINHQSKVVVGCDIGVTHVGSVLVDLHGTVLQRDWHECDPRQPVEKIMTMAQSSIRTVIESGSVEDGKLLGIGLSVPGLLDLQEGLAVFAPNLPNWRQVPIVKIVGEEYHVPVLLDNDARAMALGEYFFGAGRGKHDLICLNIGIGIGSGIILNGHLHRGMGGGSGEIGHVTVNENGPRCVCGNNGCLELMASGPAIAARAIQAVSTGAHSLINEIAHGKIVNIDAKLVAEAAQQGDKLANEILTDAGRYVGIGVATMINLLSPQMIILGGGVAQSGEPFLSAVRTTATARAYSTMVYTPEIVPAEHGDDSSALGAAALIIDQAFSNPLEAFNLV